MVIVMQSRDLSDTKGVGELDDRILIVDDEVMICSLLARRLTEERYYCLTANFGKEALGRFHECDLSLIISDLNMPEMNGMELLENV